jgi:hypothetical protein
MPAPWFYTQDGAQQGPVNDDEFRALVAAGRITPGTSVWCAGMDQWRAYAEVPDAPRPAPAVPGGASPALCAACGKAFPPDELIPLAGRPVCAACKPAMLQRLQEGAALPVAGDAAGWPGPVNVTELLAALRAREIKLPPGELLGRAWQLYRANFWPTLGVVLIFLLLQQAGGFIPFIGAIVTLLLSGVLMAGVITYLIKLVRGGRGEVADVFSGFGPRWGRYVLASLVQSIPMFVFGLLAAVVGVGFALAGASRAETAGVPLVPVLLLACGGLAAAAATVFFFFTLYVCRDLDLGPLDSARVSAAVVARCYFRVLWLLIVTGAVGLLGLVLFCVGIFLTAPLVFVAWALAYEELFGFRPAAALPAPAAPVPAPAA